MTLRTIPSAVAAILVTSSCFADCDSCEPTSPIYRTVFHSIPGIKDGPTSSIGYICCEDRFLTGWSYGVSCDWMILLENLTPAETSVSSVAAGAGAVALQNVQGFGGPACSFGTQSGPLDIDLDVDSDTNYFATADASAAAGVDLGFSSGRAVVQSGPESGKTSVAAIGSVFSGAWVGLSPGYEGSGTYNGFGIGGATTLIDAEHEYDVINPQLPTSIMLCMCVTAEGEAWFASNLANHEECGGGSSGGSGSTSFGLTAIQVTTNAEFENASGSQQAASKGVIAFMDDGSLVTLGSLSGADVPDNDPGDDLDRSGVVQIDIPSPVNNPVGLKLHISQAAIGEFDGDLDGDGDLDCHDRDIFLSLIGKDIASDPDYDFRADFDLDGIIEADDYRAFIPVMLASSDFELADFNCDGVCDNFDNLDYLDVWFPMDLAAEIVPDGVIDIFDYLEFLDAYYIGC